MLSSVELFALLRVLLGVLFMAYSAHRLFGWFGGHGPHAHAYDMAARGIQRARPWVRISAILEFVGGVSLFLGLLTPFGVAAIIISRLVEVLRMQSAKGFWNARGGYEYNIVLLTFVLLVALAGPGPIAIDPLIAFPWPYKTMLIASLLLAALGVIGGMALVSEKRRKFPTSHQTT